MADTVLVVLELGSWLGPRAGLADTVASEEHEVVMAVGANFDQFSRGYSERDPAQGVVFSAGGADALSFRVSTVFFSFCLCGPGLGERLLLRGHFLARRGVYYA